MEGRAAAHHPASEEGRYRGGEDGGHHEGRDEHADRQGEAEDGEDVVLGGGQRGEGAAEDDAGGADGGAGLADGLLGDGMTVEGARKYLRKVLSANSMGNLRLAKEYAEEPWTPIKN
nr:hypothetical protein [Actinomadura macra]